MTLYLDTSLVVAALMPEAESGRIEAWMAAQAPDGFVISDWVTAEFSAALSRKLRTRQIDAAQRAEALAAFSGLCIVNLTVLPVSREHFHVAARFADQYALDRRLSDAGPALAVATLLV